MTMDTDLDRSRSVRPPHYTYNTYILYPTTLTCAGVSVGTSAHKWSQGGLVADRPAKSLTPHSGANWRRKSVSPGLR